jgi:hypothetical protein
MRPLPILLSLFALSAALPLAATPATAALPTQFYETQLVADTPGDYTSNGALDIIGVHVSERYSYNDAERTGRETIQFRIELRARDGIKQFFGEVDMEYTLAFKANGKEHLHTVLMTQNCPLELPPGGAGPNCNREPPQVPAPHYSTADGGVVVVLDRMDADLPVGTVISDVWAASATVQGDQRAYQDVAPRDNANQPAGPTLEAPEDKGGPHDLAGTFPFLTYEVLSPINQFIVPGGTASFVLAFYTHEKVTSLDHVWIDFTKPTGWDIAGNLGEDFITTGGNQRIEYEFTVKAPTFASNGDRASILMDAALSGAGGRSTLAVGLTVSGNKVSDPAYSFALTTQGPYRAEQASAMRFEVLHEGVPLARYQVKADFLLNNEIRGMALPSTELEPGVYEVLYTFPSGGAWIVDVYVSELSPMPHQTFQVQVASAGKGLLPGPGPLLVLGLVRRRDDL